jgi:hypothetical protein
MMSGFWHWVPGISIGPFTFGEWADQSIEEYSLRKREPDCSIADWETYELPGFESWIVVKDGRIIEVYCVDALEYRDSDLIGMPSSDVVELLGKEDNKEDNVGFGYALYYHDLGLTVFVENEVVSAATCGLILSDDSSTDSI